MKTESNNKMTNIFPGLFFFVFLLSALTSLLPGQTSSPPVTAASYTDSYCSGFVSDTEPPRLGEVLGAEGGNKKNDLTVGDLIYLGNGPVSSFQKDQEVFVIRPVKRMKNLGTLYSDIAHVKIISNQGTVVIGQISFSCEPLEVGDWIVATESRILPPGRPQVALDRFAAPTGKGTGEIVLSKSERIQLGQSHIIYLNVGTDQGVQAGAIMRIFRPSSRGSVSEFNKAQYRKYSKKAQYPRQIIGECVVLWTGSTTASAIITTSLEEVALGDLVELE